MQFRGQFFDHDPITGLTEYYEETDDGKIHIHTYQDVEPVMDYCKYLANTAIPDANFRKEGWLYAIIPPILQGAMLKKGVNFLDPNDIGKVVDLVNTEYPNFKTTHRHHAIK